jgi:hypothetical protein
MDKPGVAPTVPGLPATPMQPEVSSIPERIRIVATACNTVRKEKLSEATRAFSPAPSRMGVSFITNAV